MSLILSNALENVTKKFFHLYEGPYRIVKAIGKNAFVINDVKEKNKLIGTCNRCSLRKYVTPSVSRDIMCAGNI